MTTRSRRTTLTQASHFNLKSTCANIERELILEVLDYTKNNQTLSARLLGISRTKLIYKMKEYASHLKKVEKLLQKEEDRELLQAAASEGVLTVEQLRASLDLGLDTQD